MVRKLRVYLVRIAARLRRESTMTTLEWIADRLQMDVRGYAAHLLDRHKPNEPNITKTSF